MERKIFLTSSGIIPPFPDTGSAKKAAKNVPRKDAASLVETGSDTKDDKSKPSKLLSLIRLHEKKVKGNKDYEENIDEMVDLFNHLIALYSRNGLLGGDAEKADDILSLENNASKFDGKRHGNKKGKKGKKDSNNDELRIQQHYEGLETSESSASKQQDENLIFIAVLRIFSTSMSNDETHTNNNRSGIDDDQALLITLAAELCLAISQNVKLNKTSEVCTLAEYELLAQSGKALLTGLFNIMKMVESDMRSISDDAIDNGCLTLLHCNEQTHVSILNSSMKLASSLINLFGTKLSRSTAILLDLNTIAWKILTIDNDSIQESSARLLSCLPLAGGIDRQSPSEIWNKNIEEIFTALSTVLQTVAPLTQSNAKSINASTNEFLEHWICFVRKDTLNEQSRLRCFYRFSRGLTDAICFFLLQDGLDRHHSNFSLIDAQVDIKKVLAVVESLVSFPLSSETVYYRTKRTLRDEKIDNGLLSPRTMATEVANHMKLMGHDILDSILAAVGGPTLLPYARRILRIAFASILTSSSSPVRKVMDPTSAMQLKGKKRRWLHLSVTSRKIAINTFGNAIAAFGYDYGSSSLQASKVSSMHSLIPNTDGEKAMTLVVGSLVEQICSNKSECDGYDCDWGTHLERVELISASAKCLSACIVSCGGFLSMPIRSLIESVVVNGLSQMTGTKEPSVELLCWPLAKISFLQLASACVTTPWHDGASSALVDLLNTTSNGLKHDADREVSLNAIAALRVCDTITVPRAPALNYVTRVISAANTDGTDLASRAISTDATSLASNIEDARNDAVLEREKIRKIEQAKKRESDERIQQEEKAKKLSKRRKVSTKEIEQPKTSIMPNKISKELPDTTTIDSVMKKEEEARVKNGSTKPECAPNETQDLVTKKIPAEENDITTTNDVEEDDQHDDDDKGQMKDKKENNQEMESIPKEDSDDEAFPEIFDGEPDSDIE